MIPQKLKVTVKSLPFRSIGLEGMGGQNTDGYETDRHTVLMTPPGFRNHAKS